MKDDKELIMRKYVVPVCWTMLLMGVIFAFTSCQPSGEESTAETTGTDSSLTLSEAQLAATGIQTGKLEKREVGTSLQVNGILDVPPQSLITIAAPMGGFVKGTKLLQGMKVRKGEVLATLQHQDYIQLQQDYLETKSRLAFATEEYNRQQELAKENINSGKALQQARTEFESLRATVSGLEARLELINISPASLAEGVIKSSINLYAPLNGYVTEVNVNLGQYVNAADVMFKIVDIEHLHAELQVYERDIHFVKVGQPVNFQLANERTTRKATVYLVGKEISADRTVRVHCHLQDEDPDLLPGMYISAHIETASREGEVLPSDAVVNYGGGHYIFVRGDSKGSFLMVRVKTGATYADRVEVIVPQSFDRNSEIVVDGSFTLLNLLMNQGEEE
jgi:cobalt-zinc-cadmium efflux system membrane fusion protein